MVRHPCRCSLGTHSRLCQSRYNPSLSEPCTAFLFVSFFNPSPSVPACLVSYSFTCPGLSMHTCGECAWFKHDEGNPAFRLPPLACILWTELSCLCRNLCILRFAIPPPSCPPPHFLPNPAPTLLFCQSLFSVSSSSPCLLLIPLHFTPLLPVDLLLRSLSASCCRPSPCCFSSCSLSFLAL